MILDRLMDMSIGVYILWGVGAFGLLLKIIANTYIGKLIKASENMATTRKKQLKLMRQKYENGRSLGIRGGSGEAFVEKQVRRIRLLGAPLEFWKKTGYTLCLLTWMMMAGAFLYYDNTWRGSPGMVDLIVNCVLVCAFLLALENIFLVNNKVEILKANIRDYLENLTPVREERITPATVPYIKSLGHGKGKKDETSGNALSESAATKNVKSVYNARDDNPVSETDTASDNEEVLNSFLKEFFS